jgi:hypothetical protein
MFCNVIISFKKIIIEQNQLGGKKFEYKCQIICHDYQVFHIPQLCIFELLMFQQCTNLPSTPIEIACTDVYNII